MSKKVKYIYIRHGKPYYEGNAMDIHGAAQGYIKSALPDIILDNSVRTFCEFVDEEFTNDNEGYSKAREAMDRLISDEGFLPSYDGFIGCGVMNPGTNPPANMQILVAIVDA